ncbi:ATP-binding protein (plasmid) [Paenibacillus thiaminolyticus]|uniref:ATP-binding protein n=1 Tax=Paenibacillus thiaminolyticus TaxID=49283 RepID=UPI00232ACC44|nr:ATP-binding protein [Paenibacillus thiaminolyticus]WCF11401.1 ATP-binding protein [Paenibacillus thiaminolyticus]
MDNEMFVVGRTTPRELMVASVERCFIADEYLVVNDHLSDHPVVEVVETKSYPNVTGTTFTSESGIYQSLLELKMIGTNADVHIAKVKVLDELEVPVTPHSRVSTPTFEDIENLLVPASQKDGAVLGVIKGTERIHNLLPEPLQSIAPLYQRGKGIIEQEGVPFILPIRAMREYPGVGLFGGSGSGKTFGLRVLCEEIMRYMIPGVALDPHYELQFDIPTNGLPGAQTMDFSNKHEVFQIGHNVGVNFAELNSEDLLSLLEFVGELTMPMRGALEAIHEKNDSFATLNKRVTELRDIFRKMEEPKRDRETIHRDEVWMHEKYKDKVAGTSTLQALSWRLDQLNNTGIFNSDISKVEACILKRKLAIIRGEVKLLRMLASYLFRKLYGKRRRYRDWSQKNQYKQSRDMPQKFPPFFIIMDESHIFAPDGEKMNPTKSILREIAQEARKYGVYEVFGTQRPALLDKTIVAMLNTKFIFRTSIESDMRTIQTETNLTGEQVSRLPDLTTGNAFVSSATLKKTFYIRFRTTKTMSPHESHPFDELDEFDSTAKLKEVLLKCLPISTDQFFRKQSMINEEMERVVTLDEAISILEEMAEQKIVSKETMGPYKRFKPIL